MNHPVQYYSRLILKHHLVAGPITFIFILYADPRNSKRKSVLVSSVNRAWKKFHMIYETSCSNCRVQVTFQWHSQSIEENYGMPNCELFNLITIWPSYFIIFLFLMLLCESKCRQQRPTYAQYWCEIVGNGSVSLLGFDNVLCLCLVNGYNVSIDVCKFSRQEVVDVFEKML